MRRDARLVDDQAEVVFSDAFVEQLAELTPRAQAEEVLVEVAALCAAPGGTHPLRTPLAGWNTLAVCEKRWRVVYKATNVDGTGLIEVLCLGPRSDNEVYDMAQGLVAAGVLTSDEVTQLWDALAVLAVVAEDVGLDGWDYRPPPAPDGMVRAASAAGVLDAETASFLSQSELAAALDSGWSEDGSPDPASALTAALEVARSRTTGRPDPAPGPNSVIADRATPRCGVVMPRANVHCIRRRGHPGPHRGRP